MIVDTHSHLFWKDYDGDRDAVIQRAREAGVERMLVVGTNAETSQTAWDLCAERPELHPTAGIHPHDAGEIDDEQARSRVEQLCSRPECVAVGETGLDFFKEYTPRDIQRRAFRWHLELARTLDKPVIIHCRDAHEETAELLAEVPGVRGVMHCFTMGPAQLSPYLEAGLYISFSGVVTYPKSEDNRQAAAQVPLDRLLVETDCPFLAPQGHRGKRCEPAHVRVVLEHVAELRGLAIEDLAATTTRNAAALFGLPTE